MNFKFGSLFKAEASSLLWTKTTATSMFLYLDAFLEVSLFKENEKEPLRAFLKISFCQGSSSKNPIFILRLPNLSML